MMRAQLVGNGGRVDVGGGAVDQHGVDRIRRHGNVVAGAEQRLHRNQLELRRDARKLRLGELDVAGVEHPRAPRAVGEPHHVGRGCD
jgi:hypothetical protein